MIGMFLVTSEQEICFAQYDRHETITGFRLTPERQCIVETTAGATYIFTEEPTPDIRDALNRNSDVLVAHVADDGSLLIEYNVPFKRPA
jgi:hypothetical protein